MHVGSLSFRLLGFVVIGTACSFIACSGGGGGTSSTTAPAVSIATPIITAPSAAMAGSTDLTASVDAPQAGATYTWSIDGGGTIVGSATGTSVSFDAPTPGDMTLNVTATLGTESRRGSTKIHVQYHPPAAPQISAPSSVTAGSTGLAASLVSPQGDTTYAWSINGGTITSAPSGTSIVFTAGTGSSLTLACTATNTAGSTSGQDVVAVVPKAPAQPVLTAPTQVDAGSTANVASTQSQAGCTYLWSLSNGTITSGQGTTSILFAPASGATGMVLACSVSNSASVSVSSQASITVVTPPPPTPPPTQPPPTPPPTPTATGYYGSCINADDIANIVVGYNKANDTINRITSYRFTVAHDGNLSAIRPFFIWSTAKVGYNLGTGGTIQIQVQSDDGSTSHLPSGKAMASLTYANPCPPANTNHWPLLTFSSPVPVAKGQIIHFVFHNIDADPSANWVSLDCLWQWTGCSQIQPTVSNTDMQILEQDTSGAWVVYSRGTGHSITPIMELDYSDGYAQGQGYIQGFGAPDSAFVNPKPISGTQAVRETFTVSGGDKTVASVALRVNRTSGTSPLTVSITGADGTVVAKGTVQVPLGAAATGASNASTWNTVTFASPVTLKGGTPYYLLLTSPADTVHTTHVLAKGSTYGYSGNICFGDGYAQFNDGTNGWTGWDLWGVKNRTDTDLQFYFITQ